MKALAVFLNRTRVGTLQQEAGLSFAYDEEYLASKEPTPLSLSLPLRPGQHTNRPVLSWVNGLLPADRQVRQRIADRHGVRANNPAALLAAIGLDCPGAVQVCHADRTDEVTSQTGSLVKVDDQWVSDRLARLRQDEASWQVSDERWSLGGGQSKFALRRDQAGKWYDPKGSEPSTHIIKTGVQSAKYQGLNEHISLQALRNIGVPAARSEYLDFAGQPALVVERFDRQTTDDVVGRLHTEDLCQALGNQTAYERYGGPTARQILELLGSRAGQRSRERFVEALACNYLLGAPDGHARNYSIFLRGGQVALAPLYDIASSLPYDIDGEGIMHMRKVAMSIGGERTFGMIGVEHWRRFFATNSVDQSWGFDMLRSHAEALPDAVSDAFADVEDAEGAAELERRLVAEVARSCQWVIDELDGRVGAPLVVQSEPQLPEAPGKAATWVPEHTRGGRLVKAHWRRLR